MTIDSELCKCHMKHVAVLERLDEDIRTDAINLIARQEKNKEAHEKLWSQIGTKLSSKWLLAIVPFIIAWFSFQMVIYEAVKMIGTEVAVIKVQVQAIQEIQSVDGRRIRND